jgi:hypothetical protein
VRPGSGRKNTDRDIPSRGRRDSVRVARTDGCGSITFRGEESSDEGGVGVGDREGSGEVWCASQPPWVLGTSEAMRRGDSLRVPSPSSSSSRIYGLSMSSSPRRRGSPWSSNSRSSRDCTAVLSLPIEPSPSEDSWNE